MQCKVANYVFIPLAIILLFVGTIFYINENNFVKNSLVTNGKVESNNYISHGKGCWRPVINFTTQNNQEITFESGLCSNPWRYNV